MFFREKRSPDPHSLRLPMLPLKEVVVLPHANLALTVGRPKSLAAVEQAKGRDRQIFLVTQRLAEREEPGPDDVFAVGTIAHIENTLNMPDGTVRVILAGRHRARILDWVQSDPYFEVELERIEPVEVTREVLHLVRTVKTTFETYQKHNRDVPPEMVLAINAMEDPERLADTLIHNLSGLKVADRQQALEERDVEKRLQLVYQTLQTEIEFRQVERKHRQRSRKQAEHSKRESVLEQQMRDIQRELGDRESKGDLDDLAQALAERDLPELVRTRAERELRKLSQMNAMSAEATVLRTYLETLIDLPWSERSAERPGLDEAEAILDEDHYGLDKIKERIIEYLAVETLVDRMRGPILCLVGPPGVGKTSLARSIARATGRPFVRIALGGVRDEAEIRGHRRTYIGAMPGKLIQAMRRAGTVDPVMLLDEVDKMSSDFRGDPASALLEVLDPEQNTAFGDHYLDIDYDLSRVTFICTANTLDGIPIPLRDRLEIIRLTGYSDREKIEIGRRYLIPKQLRQHGLSDEDLRVPDDALQGIIRGWTREAGVRDLERKVAKLCRRVARKVVARGREEQVTVTPELLSDMLGVQVHEPDRNDQVDQVGLVRGLGVSQVGGSVLEIEVAALPGKGKLTLTGRPGEVMKESSSAVFTYVRSRAEALGLDPDFYETNDFHIHYPGLASGVEGPSAGIAMATAMVSALTGVPARHDTAMTGELSLRGRVLKIGGLKEKLLAAHRAGIRRVIIPERNRPDLDDVPGYVLDAIEILPAEHMDRVLLESLSSEGAAALFRSGRGSPSTMGSQAGGER
ncbi:MAG: endopeptidase La [Deltaproteobacteria bacterium]|nr:MAG: endopeptidase La [Deltaproteobacteria bacterium]